MLYTIIQKNYQKYKESLKHEKNKRTFLRLLLKAPGNTRRVLQRRLDRRREIALPELSRVMRPPGTAAG